MSAPAWLIREVERAIQNGSPQCRAAMVRRIGGLFLERDDFNADHIRLFDQVLSRLLMDADLAARRELADRLASLDNAPVGVIRLLARDDAIEVARPVLERSPQLADDDLVDIAAHKGEPHLLAISRRTGIAEPVSELLVRRGGREVVRTVAANCSARLTDDTFFSLVERAESDVVLAEKVGSRPDLPPRLFSHMLHKATNKAAKLTPIASQSAMPERSRATQKLCSTPAASAEPDDQPRAQDTGKTSPPGATLDEAAVRELANGGKYQDLISALACLGAVPVEVVEQLVGSKHPDPILILCKSAGWAWDTAKAILMARPASRRISDAQLDAALVDFQRLTSATALRVRRFWQFTLTRDEAATPQ